MKILGQDLDELLAYETLKVVVVKDAKLGCLQLSLKLAIFCYIFIWTILYKGAHLHRSDIEGVFRVTLRHPTLGLCDPFLIGCEANFTPMTELPYCSESSQGYTTPDGRDAVKKPCQYWDYVESRMDADGGVFVPTRVRRFQQRRGCVPSEANGWQCNENGNVLYNFVDDKMSLLKSAEFNAIARIDPQNSLDSVRRYLHGKKEEKADGGPPDDGKNYFEATPYYDIYVGDVEHFTFLLDHGIRDDSGLQQNDFSMNGDWLDCPSAGALSKECKRHRIVCGHGECPADAVAVGGGAEAEGLKAEQQEALSGGSAFVGVRQRVGSRRLRDQETRRLRDQVMRARPRPGHLGHLDVEDAEGDGPDIGFHRAGGGLLPGHFDGFPVAANMIGDMFDLGSIIKMAGMSLDDIAVGHGIEGTRRDNGMVLVVHIEYSNTHAIEDASWLTDDSPWLGLRITPFSEPPRPTYTYRVFSAEEDVYQTTRTTNDPSDAERIIRVYNGMRIVVDQRGGITRWSLSKFIIFFTGALGLLAVSTTLTELIMLNLLPRREEYKHRKFYQTEDMNHRPGEDEEAVPEEVIAMIDGFASGRAGKEKVWAALQEIMRRQERTFSMARRVSEDRRDDGRAMTAA